MIGFGDGDCGDDFCGGDDGDDVCGDGGCGGSVEEIHWNWAVLWAVRVSVFEYCILVPAGNDDDDNGLFAIGEDNMA